MITKLNVPYAEKDQAKALGARWNQGEKVWYVENVENLAAFMKWIPKHLLKPTKKKKPRRGGRDMVVRNPITIGAEYDPALDDGSIPWLD